MQVQTAGSSSALSRSQETLSMSDWKVSAQSCRERMDLLPRACWNDTALSDASNGITDRNGIIGMGEVHFW